MSITGISAELLVQAAKQKKNKTEEATGFAQFLQAETAGGQATNSTSSPTAAVSGVKASEGRKQVLDAHGKSLWADEQQQSTSDADIEEFLKFASMTPAEKIRYLMLKEKGLTEESLAALPPAEREKIEKEIADAIERKVKESAGIYGGPEQATTDAAGNLAGAA